MARKNSKIRRREDNANRISNAIVRRAKVPRMVSNGNVTRVSGSELLFSSVSVATAGSINSFPINFFTSVFQSLWLTRQALCYNKYKFNRLTLRYVPYCPTSQSGRIVIAWNGDYGDNVPTTTQQVTQYENSVEAPAWRETSCNALISRQPEFVVENTTGDATENASGPSTQGEFVVCADGGATSSSVNVGSLYLDYEVSFWSRAPFSTNS